MKFQTFITVAFLLWGANTSEIFTRTLRWTSLDGLLAAGWQAHDNQSVQYYDRPSDMDSRLEALNNNFTNKVWGWKAMATSDTNWFKLDWSTFPEYCGLVNASLSIKIYFSGSRTKNYMWPWTGPTLHYYMEPIPVVKWETFSIELEIPHRGFFQFRYFDNAGSIQIGELVVIDELSLTYSIEHNDDCPNSCNHDCEYRGIDCHNYYTCVDRKYKEFHTCNADEGLAFNPITKVCDFMENVEGCHPEPEICICAYKPHETNCSSFYFCNNTCIPEECELRSCSPGLVWSVDAMGDGSGLQQCVKPDNASCQAKVEAKTKEMPELIYQYSADSKDETKQSFIK